MSADSGSPLSVSGIDPGQVVISLMAAVMFGAVGCGEGASENGGGASVEITRPSDDSFVTTPRVEIAGEVDGAEMVTVRGEEIEAVAGEWSTEVTLGEGGHTITASVDGDEDQVTVTVDTEPPTLTVESPERGSFIEVDDVPDNRNDRTVNVTGTVEDQGTGVSTVAIEGGPEVPVDAESFTREWHPAVGLNQLRVVATDRAGNKTTALRGVMYGETVDPTAAVGDALSLALAPGAFSTVATVVEDYMTPDRVEMFVKDSVDVSGFTVDDVTFSNLSVDTTVDPRGPNGDSVEAVIAVEDFRMEGTATFTSDPIPMAITVAELTAIVELEPVVTDDNILLLEERDSELQLDPADVDFEFTGDESSPVDDETVEQVAVAVARGAFRDYVIERLTDQLYDPAVLNRQVALLGRTLEFTVEPTAAEVAPDGLFLNADLAMPGDRFTDVPQIPGALSRTLGSPGASAVESEMEVMTQQRALDRLLHSAWRAGLFHQSVSQQTLEGQELPVELNAGSLSLVLDDRISTLADPSTPAALEFRPLLPPVASLEASGDGEDGGSGSEAQTETLGGAADVRVGGMLVDLELRPESAETIPVATVAVFLEMDVTLGIEGVTLTLNFDAEAETEVVEEPTYDLDDAQIESVMSGLLEAAPSALSDGLEISGERDLDYVSLEETEIDVHGLENDHATVGATVTPNPGALVE